VNRRQGSEQKPQRRGLGRGVWVAYLSTGAALAILHVSLVAWVEYRSVLHQMTETVYDLFLLLRSEILLGEYSLVGGIDFESLTLHLSFWASLLTLGNFTLATKERSSHARVSACGSALCPERGG
jgi:hypothetical protein